MKYTAVIRKTQNWYLARCEQMLEAMTQGKTVEEALENLKDAMLLLMEDEIDDLRKDYEGIKFIRKEIAVL